MHLYRRQWRRVRLFVVTAAVTVGFLLASAVDGRADVVFWAAANSGAFGTVNVQTGAFTQTGTLTGIASGLLGDLALSPGGTLYTELSDQTLATVDPVGTKVTVIGATGGNNIFAIRFRSDGVLFGGSHTDLFTIDPATATATHIGAFGVGTSGYYDLVFDDHDTLFMTQNTGMLYRVDTTTGAATAVGPMGLPIVGAAFAEGMLYGTTTDSAIVTINTTTGVGTRISMETPTGTFIFSIANGPASVDGGASQDGGADGVADAPSSNPETGDAMAGEDVGSAPDAGNTADGADAGASADSGANRHSSSGGCSCDMAAPSAPILGITSVVVALVLALGRRRARR